MRFRVTLLASAMSAAMVLAGCGTSAGTTDGAVEPSEVFVAESMPRALPDDFLFPENTDVLLAQDTTGDAPSDDAAIEREDRAAIMFFKNGSPPQDLFFFFLDALSDRSWDLGQCNRVERDPEDILTISAEREGQALLVTIGNIPGVHPKVDEPYDYYVWILPKEGEPPVEAPSTCDPEKLPPLAPTSGANGE